MGLCVGYTYSNLSGISDSERLEMDKKVALNHEAFREGFKATFPATLAIGSAFLISSVLPAYATDLPHNSSGTNPCSSTGNANPGTGSNPCHTPPLTNTTGNGTNPIIPVVAGKVLARDGFWLGVACAVGLTISIGCVIITLLPYVLPETEMEMEMDGKPEI